ncbi:LOW QUALITY PROTEIN: hypothetical protein Cgig2_013424 [Carnegiea gigantea]|uniref:Uncharacterized protein n=1 Tax=Carnegiea gigantea TaxID=171969 RepID=A0A9Q1JVN8_9CARY|nr:LOW QUALITY PROTEIN: hypothetical protein Cgig2_013424 [Carnegiea gigantea]
MVLNYRPSSAYNSPFFTTNFGAPVWNNNSSLTVGSRGIFVFKSLFNPTDWPLGTLVDSNETQPPSQPLDQALIYHDDRIISDASSDATGNPGALEDRYCWAVQHAYLLKEAYWDKGKNHLKDMVCKVSKKKPTDVIPRISSDSKLNKATRPKAGTRHVQGSASYSAIAKKMRKAGEIVTAVKLFSKTHTKAKDKIFTDDRAKAEKYQSLKMKKQVPPSQEDDSLFLEGVSEKGTIYGLGNSVALFYEKPVNHTTSKKSSYTPSITELYSIKSKLQQQHIYGRATTKQQRQLEQQQRMMQKHKHRMEEQQRMLKAQCKMMEDQKQALLGM